jgi:HK97 family phage prohead protease
MPITDFPAPGGDKKVDLRNSEYPVFPDIDYLIELQEEYPDIWDEGGNIRGNQQFRLLLPMATDKRAPETPAEEEAVRLREAWAARHLEDFRLAGVIAQMKWLVVGSRGIDHMKAVVEEAKQAMKKLQIEAKLLSNNAGKYQFVISTDQVDRQNEVIDQNGWDFSNWLANPVIIDSHRYDSIDDIIGVGIGEPIRLANGWAVDIQFADTPKGQRAKTLVDSNMLRTVSVGFRSLKRSPVNGVVKHTAMELLEVSLVAIPANPGAVRIKGANMDDRYKDGECIELESLYALRDHLLEAMSGVMDMIRLLELMEIQPEPEAPVEEPAPAPAEAAPATEPAEAESVNLVALKQLLAAFKSA